MKRSSFPTLYISAATVAVAWCASMVASSPAIADVNIGALACQPPYQEQAGIIRWHEHYLINPRGSFDAWVVCPIAFETREIFDPFTVGAFGNVKPPLAEFHVCYLNVVDLRNQHIPLVVPIDAKNPDLGSAPFLNNPGQDMTFVKQMENINTQGTIWVSQATATHAQVNAGMTTPPPIPGFSNEKGPGFWTITVNCYLPDGYSLGMVSLY